MSPQAFFHSVVEIEGSEVEGNGAAVVFSARFYAFMLPVGGAIPRRRFFIAFCVFGSQVEGTFAAGCFSARFDNLIKVPNWWVVFIMFRSV